ncbi:MAG: AbrB/MazE/SpoVT family DNA-binding domain-containing protein [Candidatus Aegiribacteria sp.]|nr:AbrB/MazE/SpoVT family DNA-binding domain-containing protein [Candidatus Aegiribacteria sp.]
MKIDLDNVTYIGETSVTIRSSRRRITIPKEIVEELHISDGDRIRWVLFNDGNLCISRVKSSSESSGSSMEPEIEKG